MRAIGAPGASVRYRSVVLVRGFGHAVPALGPIASASLRSLVLIAVAMLLILVLLPAALGAAGIPVGEGGLRIALLAS
jgi:hypothetical protein